MSVSKQWEKVKEELEELGECSEVDNVVEELADVFVSLERLTTLLYDEYKFTEDELVNMYNYKKARTERRLKEGYYDEK